MDFSNGRSASCGAEKLVPGLAPMVEGTARNGASATASSRRLAVHVLGLGREILRSALLYSVYAILSVNCPSLRILGIHKAKCLYTRMSTVKNRRIPLARGSGFCATGCDVICHAALAGTYSCMGRCAY